MNRVSLFIIALALLPTGHTRARLQSPDPANLLTNGGFEKGLEGWELGKDMGMSLVKPEAARSGDAGLRVTDEDETRGSSLGSVKFPAQPGKTYSATFWGRLMSGKDAMVYIQFFDTDGEQLNRKESNNTISAKLRGESWKEYSFSGVAPANAVTVRVWVHTLNAGKVIADFDDFVLVEKQ